MPLGRWFRHELRSLVGDTLSGTDTFVGRLFPRGFVGKLLDSHINGSRDMSARLWTLLVLQRWHERYAY